jgi:hypothetical protein
VRGLIFARPTGAPLQSPATAPAYAPPARLPEAISHAPLPATSTAEYETAQAQAPQSLGYARPSDEAVSKPTIEYLRQTRPWVLLISIIMFIAVGLMAVGGLFGMLGVVAGGAIATSKSSMRGAGGSPAAAAGAVVGIGIVMMIVMLAYAALLFFPALFLMKYASAIKRLLASGQTRDLEAAMKAQKSYWMFIGILTLIGIAFYILAILFSVAQAFH